MSGEEEKGRGNVLDYEQVSRAAQGAEKEHQEQERQRRTAMQTMTSL